MSKLLLGDVRPGEIFLSSEQEVQQIYLGQDLIWERQPDITNLFQNLTEYVPFSWGGSDFTFNYGSDRCTISSYSSYSAKQFYMGAKGEGNHAYTINPVRVPRGVTQLNVQLRDSYGMSSDRTHPKFKFGLLPPNAPSSTDASNGGILSGNLTASGSWTTYSITLNENFVPSPYYHVVFATYRSENGRADCFLRRIWFS